MIKDVYYIKMATYDHAILSNLFLIKSFGDRKNDQLSDIQGVSIKKMKCLTNFWLSCWLVKLVSHQNNCLAFLNIFTIGTYM